MSETPATQSAPAYTPTPIIVERRFPLDLDLSISSIRALYETGKQSRWTPATAIPWDDFDDTAPSAQARAAASLWSRRAWVEYTGLLETPALLIRFCLEAGREADPKYFLTVRNTEEAWHVECFHRYARALGGYLERPANPAWEPVLNRTLYRQALDASQPLDIYVAVNCALEDGLELDLFELYAGNAREPVAAAMLEKVVASKRRNASFGWLYLEERARQMSESDKKALADELARWVESVAFAGYHIPSLSVSIDAAEENRAALLAAEAGLGAALPQAEQKLFVDYLGRVRARLAQMGIALKTFEHPVLGEV